MVQISIKPDNLNEIPQWKLWLLIGSSGIATLMLIAACLAPKPSESKPIYPAILGLGTTGVFTFGTFILKRNYVRYSASEYVRTENTKTIILDSLLTEVDTPSFKAQIGGCCESVSDDNRSDDWGQSEASDIKLYDWNDLVDEAVGVIIAGQSGAGKTSVACWVLGKLTENEPAQIKVCDPHYNDIWEEIGLPSIGEFDEIQSEFEWLLAELDRRRIRKKNKEPLGENLIIVADEIGACIESFSNPQIIEKTLKRIGSEGRKFGITLVAIDQSPNSGDIGISAKKRDNYLMIGLCSVAVALAKQDMKNTDPVVQYLSAIAYPCVVKMGGIITPAIHPTHHSYTQFKKKGNAPLNLLPINQIHGGDRPIVASEAPEPVNHATTQDHVDREMLERLYRAGSRNHAPRNEEAIKCPDCASRNVARHAKNRNGSQRYRCSDCNKTWTLK